MGLSRASFLSPGVAPGVVYAVLCAALWPFPVLGILHVESSAIVAGTAFFAGGLAAVASFRGGRLFDEVLFRQLALLSIPLILLTLTLLWRPNCGYLQGLMLFVLFAVPSVALAVALAYFLTRRGGRRASTFLVVIGLGVSILTPLFDLGLHPQLFTYNHVWGGVLGPLYDEELAIRPGLFFFRGLTLCWAIALLMIGDRSRRRQGLKGDEPRSRLDGLALLGVAVVIGGTYVAVPWLGINTPAWMIENRLGGHLAVDRFDIYFDPENISEGELRLIADEHRYRYHQISEALEVDVDARISTYLYPDPETKAALTGSRLTSVVPTWQFTPQIHMLQDRFAGSFAHELVHVVAREFGMPVLRASPAIGLVEGLAVALEPPSGRPSVHQQVAEGLRMRQELGVYESSLAESVAAQLSPTGFWSGRGGVSYVTTGSFVRYLLDAYGPEPMREAYRTGRLARAFDRPVIDLAREWEEFIAELPEDEEAALVARARFSVPSLFERRCPHHVPAHVRRLREARTAIAAGDTARALDRLDRALEADSTNASVLNAWAAAHLAVGRQDEALARLQRAEARLDTPAGPALLTRLADALRVGGRHADADSLYAVAAERLPEPAVEQRALLGVRQALSLSTEALQDLLAPTSTRRRAEALQRRPGTEAFAALLLAELGDHAEAVALLERAAALLPPAVRLSWEARFRHAAGDLAGATRAARGAVANFETAGQHTIAEREQDRLAMLEWLAAQGNLRAFRHAWGETFQPPNSLLIYSSASGRLRNFADQGARTSRE